MTIQPGTRLGPYEIVASIGAGGMGEVWRARDTRLDRDVAIKVLPPGFAENEQLRQRFEREAKAISQLNHPNVCTLFDVGQERLAGSGEQEAVGSAERGSQGADSEDPVHRAPSTVHYLVMEYLEGESLADRIRKGPLALHEVLKFGQQIASALDAAHRRGITHRDLKPGNVMLTKSGAKLLDFGLAKTASEGQAPLDGLTNLPTEAKPLTTEGTILGTFQYMAPEQLEGLEADARTDIFALGAVLYEMATGHRAFQGGSKTSLIAAIVSTQPAPISSVVAMAPPALDHVVRKCLEKDPDDRWQSAHDVAGQLQWISEAGSQAGVAAPVTIRRKTRERLAWTVAAVLAVASVALLATRPRNVATPVPSFRATIPPPEGTSLIPFDEAGLALSPDGLRLAFVATDEASRRIWIRELSSAVASPVPETEGASYPFWSPDGQSLGFFADGELKRIDLRGGSPRRIAAAPTGRGATWGPNGLILYAPSFEAPITMVSADGGDPKPVAKFDPKTQVTHRWPIFLPDGEHFLYVVRLMRPGNTQVGQLRVASINGTDERILIDDSTIALYVEPGYLIYGRGENIFASRFDVETLQISGDPIPIVPEKMSFWEPKNFIPFTASADGTIAYLPQALLRSEIVFFSREGRRLETPGEGQNYLGGVRISPDGTKISYGTGTSQKDVEYWIRDLALERADRVTDSGGPAPVSCPRCPVEWLPDSTRVTYPCMGEASDICIKSLLDGNPGRPLIQSSNWKIYWSWLPDASAVVYAEQNPETQYDLMLATIGETTVTTPLITAPSNERQPIVSPDGQWLAYASDSTGRNEIYVRRLAADSGQWQISRDGGSTPRWRKDEIFYVTPDGRIMVVPVRVDSTFRAGQATELFRLPEPTESLFEDVTPDGQRILAVIPTERRSSIAFQLITNWRRLLEDDRGGSN